MCCAPPHAPDAAQKIDKLAMRDHFRVRISLSLAHMMMNPDLSLFSAAICKNYPEAVPDRDVYLYRL